MASQCGHVNTHVDFQDAAESEEIKLKNSTMFGFVMVMID